VTPLGAACALAGVLTAVLGSAACAGTAKGTSSVAALGDSITARYRLKYSYPDLIHEWRGVPVDNFGVSGDTTAQMRERLPALLRTTPLPQVVIVLGGTNDVARGMPVEDTLRNLQLIAQEIRAAGAQPVLVAPPPSGAFRLESIRAVRAGLNDYARREGIVLVDPWPAMEDPARPGWMRPELALDTLHPNERGQVVLAREIARAMGWPAPPSGGRRGDAVTLR
jgi:acyl-CoA thioesterase I